MRTRPCRNGASLGCATADGQSGLAREGLPFSLRASVPVRFISQLGFSTYGGGRLLAAHY